MKKQVIILVGLKGSGKTYVAALMQEKAGIKFFRVENVWLSLTSERLSEEYISEGFILVEKELENLLAETDRIIIESTGTTQHFCKFLGRLRYKYNVKLIKINASPILCLERIKSRDSSLHVPVSDDILDRINRDAMKVNFTYDLILDNERSTDSEIIEHIQRVIGS